MTYPKVITKQKVINLDAISITYIIVLCLPMSICDIIAAMPLVRS